MTCVTLVCKMCGKKARRKLLEQSGNRGVHETASEKSLCPNGHGMMSRLDKVPQENWTNYEND